MTFYIITIFPDIFASYFNESILKRAQKKDLINIKIYDLRDWTTDKHKTVDDTPYGGGAGMVMKADVIHRAVCDIQKNIDSNNPNYELRITNYESKIKPKSKIQKPKNQNPKSKIVLFSAKGKTWNQQLAQKYSKLDNVIMICGRYEGIDERVKKFVDEEISIGDYVLTGGEIPAMVLIDSASRLIPDVLGNKVSLEKESFNQNPKSKIQNLEFPQYTRPEILEIDGKKHKVPAVLTSGNHKLIEEWRCKNSKQIKSKTKQFIKN